MSASGGTPATAVANNPAGVPVSAASGNVANAAAVATLPAAAGKTTWLTGFTVTAGGSTAALDVVVTVTGLAVPLAFAFTFPAGATVGAAPLVVTFPTPVAASAVNTAVVVTVPAGGLGNTNAAVTATGFQL